MQVGTKSWTISLLILSQQLVAGHPIHKVIFIRRQLVDRLVKTSDLKEGLGLVGQLKQQYNKLIKFIL